MTSATKTINSRSYYIKTPKTILTLPPALDPLKRDLVIQEKAGLRGGLDELLGANKGQVEWDPLDTERELTVGSHWSSPLFNSTFSLPLL